MVCIWRQKLRDQVAVAGVDLDGVEARLDCEFHGAPIGVSDLVYLFHIHLLDESRGVEVESSACAVRHTSAYTSV